MKIFVNVNINSVISAEMPIVPTNSEQSCFSLLLNYLQGHRSTKQCATVYIITIYEIYIDMYCN